MLKRSSFPAEIEARCIARFPVPPEYFPPQLPWSVPSGQREVEFSEWASNQSAGCYRYRPAWHLLLGVDHNFLRRGGV
ncbi:hypothetical protein B0H19DRAFT_1156214, partial [Mycena capillaripes]